MKIVINLIWLGGFLVICFVGISAALLGLRRLDAWASRLAQASIEPWKDGE